MLALKYALPATAAKDHQNLLDPDQQPTLCAAVHHCEGALEVQLNLTPEGTVGE